MSICRWAKSKAAAIYEIPRSSLQHRAGKRPRPEIPANLRKLTDSGEQALLERVLDFNIRGFEPQLSDPREMADRLRTARGASRTVFNTVLQHAVSPALQRPIQAAGCLQSPYGIILAFAHSSVVLRTETISHFLVVEQNRLLNNHGTLSNLLRPATVHILFANDGARGHDSFGVLGQRWHLPPLPSLPMLEVT